MRFFAFVLATSAAVFSVAATSADPLRPMNPSNFQYLPAVEKIETIFRPGEPVLIIGDSLVEGKGVPRDRTLPALFDDLVIARVTGAGRSGETSAGLVKRLRGSIRREAYRWCIVATGGNDILRDQTGDTLRNNLVTIIKEIRAAQTHPVLIAIPDPRTMNDLPVYREVATAMRVPVLEGMGKKLEARHFQPDGVHPNAEGYKVVAVALMNFFAKNSTAIPEMPTQRPTSEDNVELEASQVSVDLTKPQVAPSIVAPAAVTTPIAAETDPAPAPPIPPPTAAPSQ